MIDFNDAPPQKEYELIPSGTVLKATLTLQKNSDGSVIHEGRFSSNTKYLKCVFDVTERPYLGRKVFLNIGISGSEEFVNIGRSQIRGIIESAICIRHDDMSEKAKRARHIERYEELNGLTVQIKVTIKTDPSGKYKDKNYVSKIITPDCHDYLQVGKHVSELKDDGIPF